MKKPNLTDISIIIFVLIVIAISSILISEVIEDRIKKTSTYTTKSLSLPEEIDLIEEDDLLRVYKIDKDSIYLEFKN